MRHCTRRARAAEHADLHGVHADVGHDGANLREDDLRRHRVDGAHARRVLCCDRGDRARAVHAAARERLQVGLDPRPSARVRAGDRQRDGRHPRLLSGERRRGKIV